MNKLKKGLAVVAFLAMGLSITSCGSESGAQEEAVHTEHATEEGMEYTSAYVCPMHCEGSGSDQPGECPVCGMTYEENDHAGDHDHDHDHAH